jgi:hypothetical protein
MYKCRTLPTLFARKAESSTSVSRQNVQSRESLQMALKQLVMEEIDTMELLETNTFIMPTRDQQQLMCQRYL